MAKNHKTRVTCDKAAKQECSRANVTKLKYPRENFAKIAFKFELHLQMTQTYIHSCVHPLYSSREAWVLTLRAPQLNLQKRVLFDPHYQGRYSDTMLIAMPRHFFYLRYMAYVELEYCMVALKKEPFYFSSSNETKLLIN